MKLFKLNITGNNNEFTINYTASTNFINYLACGFDGSEQEKYNLFLEDLRKNGGPQPINIKMKMTTQTTDRALAKNEVVTIKEVNDFINRLSK